MDPVQHLYCEIGGISGIIEAYTNDIRILNLLAVLKDELPNGNLERIKYSLNEVYSWYEYEMDRIIKNSANCDYDVHVSNKNKIYKYLREIECEKPVDDSQNNPPVVFISHKSDDKKYGNAIRRFLIGLGVKNSQLIYTSHDLNAIPTGAVIFDYIRQHINSKNYIVFLLSDKYFDSSICLNEMGAAWVVQADHICFFVPSFNFHNQKYEECVASRGEMGILLNGDDNCRHRMIDFKNTIQSLFNLANDEFTVESLLNDFIREIS